MKTFQTKRAAKLFRKFHDECDDSTVVGYALSDFRGGGAIAYRALRDLVREFCEERKIMVETDFSLKTTYRCRIQRFDGNGMFCFKTAITYDLALLAALEKALEVK